MLVGLWSLMISVAHADTPTDAAAQRREMSWAITATELAGVGAFALHLGAGIKPTAPIIALDVTAVLGLGTAAAFAAHRWELDERVPLAIHGAGWFGLPMFLLGTLIDGRDTGFGSRVGTAAYVLGAAGAVGGLLVGSRVKSDTGMYTLLGAPVGGFLAGGIFIGLPLMLATGNTNQATGRLTTGAVIGGVFGIGVATFLVLRHQPEAPVARAGALPILDVAPGRVAVSFGGSF
jgi:hypothetical protein